MKRRYACAVLVVIALAVISACQPKSTPPPVTLAFSQAAPASLQVNTTASITAVVSDDPSNAGVDWTVSCGSMGGCGSFSPAHTASGAATTFTAPTLVPSGGTVTITATATASKTATLSATITVQASPTGAPLNGQFAFVISGVNAESGYVAAGSLIADGSNNITGGEEDFVDAFLSDTFTFTGTYAVGSDGRGTINLSTNDANVPTQIMGIVMTSPSHGQIIELDNFATASGTIDLQTTGAFSASQLTGGYSFSLSAMDLATSFGVAFGGIMTGDGSGGFTNMTLDVDNGGAYSSSSATLPVITTPDSFGRGVVANSTTEWIYYIVNAKVLRILEADSSFLSSGSAYAQPASPSVANLAGMSVFVEAGISSSGALSLGGQFAADANGNVTSGFMDVNAGGTVASGSIAGSAFSFPSGSARGAWTLAGGVNANVTQFQVYLVDPGLNILDPNSQTGGGGALFLESDGRALGNGMIINQANSATLQGNYGINLQAITTGTTVTEIDVIGQIQADGAGNLSGKADFNNSGLISQGQTLSGATGRDQSVPGRFTVTLTLGTLKTVAMVFYGASDRQFLAVEADSQQVVTGVLIHQ